MNICVNCKFYRRSLSQWLKKKPPMCKHYATANVITGEASITCERNRSNSGGDFCGNLGRFFEPKKVPAKDCKFMSDEELNARVSGK